MSRRCPAVFHVAGQVLSVSRHRDLLTVRVYEDLRHLGTIDLHSPTSFVPTTAEGTRRRTRPSLMTALEALVTPDFNDLT